MQDGNHDWIPAQGRNDESGYCVNQRELTLELNMSKVMWRLS